MTFIVTVQDIIDLVIIGLFVFFLTFLYFYTRIEEWLRKRKTKTNG